MASKRVVQLLGLRSDASITRQTSRLSFQTTRTLSFASHRSVKSNWLATPQFGISKSVTLQQKRWDSRAAKARGTKIYQFEDVLHILEAPSDARLLIDVREPHEFNANTIPTAINIPVTSQPDALFLDNQEFYDKFSMQKPPKEKEVVFFCKAGVRSSSAAGLARQAGYTNVGEYRGSWNDWQKRGGPGTKTPPKPDGIGEPKAPITETKPTARTESAGEEHLGGQGIPESPEGPLGGRQ